MQPYSELRIVGTTKQILTTMPSPLLVWHATVKVRSLGTTGTYIALGSSKTQAFRFKNIHETLDIDPLKAGVPFDLNKTWVVSDAVDAELEIIAQLAEPIETRGW